ncbi:MAG TPA: AraC family transcriptional regulator [Candidatus Saccharimonadales bacterium]|nr:AraC family transcriptional regulator [Candidatus Saccharimonadales bacterium]
MQSETNSFYRYFPISRRDKNWGLYVTTAGEARITPHTPYPPCGHPKGYAFDWQHGRILDGFALIYISTGRGTFESKPAYSRPVEPGHAFLLFPGVWHRYTPSLETGWHEHWIGFDGETARRWLKHRFISPKVPVLKINAEDSVLAIFARIMQSVRAHRPALQQILAGATADLLGLFYAAQHMPPAVPSQNANTIEKAIARLQNEFSTDVNMKALAREGGVSYSWFRSTFAAHTGLSPHQYLLELRIVHARNLLAASESSVKEIAMQTGFEDEHYFSRLFRQKMAMSPSEWRRRNRPRS